MISAAGSSVTAGTTGCVRTRSNDHGTRDMTLTGVGLGLVGEFNAFAIT